MQQNNYKDPHPDAIAQKLAEVEAFEAKHGENTLTRSWRKWCSDPAYRRREWEFRQSTVNLNKVNTIINR